MITLGSGALLDFYTPAEKGEERRLIGSVWLTRLHHGIRHQSEDVITERVFNRTEAHLPVGTVIPRHQRVSLTSHFDGK